MQLRPGAILECKARISTVSQHLRNREILLGRLVEREESLICGFVDGPSDCEEREPFLRDDRGQVSLGDGSWDRRGQRRQ